MTTADDRCGWDTGTAWTGPARCGKPAKAATNNPGTDNGKVCGIHARKAKTCGAPVTQPDYYTVTPL